MEEGRWEAGEPGIVPACGMGWADHRAGARSEEDNPQAMIKAAAVGERAWHCRSLLLLCCGYQQKSARLQSWVKWDADQLVLFLWSESQGHSGTIS